MILLKTKRFIALFLYIIFVLFLEHSVDFYIHFLTNEVKETGRFSTSTILKILLPYLIGFLLSIPKVCEEITKKGSWKWDWVKFLAIGIPSFYISAFRIFYYVPLINYLYAPKFFFFSQSSLVLDTTAIIFGFILLGTLYKEGDLYK